MVRNSNSVSEKRLRNVLASFSIDSFQVPIDVVLEAQSYLEEKEREKQGVNGIKRKRLVIEDDSRRRK